MPDREAYELRISLLKEHIKRIKRGTNYRTSLINRLKSVKTGLILVKMPEDYTNKIDATIEYLEELNDL